MCVTISRNGPLDASVLRNKQHWKVPAPRGGAKVLASVYCHDRGGQAPAPQELTNSGRIGHRAHMYRKEANPAFVLPQDRPHRKIKALTIQAVTGSKQPYHIDNQRVVKLRIALKPKPGYGT